MVFHEAVIKVLVVQGLQSHLMFDRERTCLEGHSVIVGSILFPAGC